jgi:DNA-binding NarL/FixJ family response regulator
MEYTNLSPAPAAFTSFHPDDALRLFIAEPEQAVRDSLALVLGAMDETYVVCRASSAADAGQWLAAHPFGWDVALVDAGIAADAASGLKYCGRHAWVEQTVVVLCDAATPSSRFNADAALACYDKRRDLERILALCMQLRNPGRGRHQLLQPEQG